MQSSFVPVDHDNTSDLQIVLMDIFNRQHSQGDTREHLLMLTNKEVLYFRDSTNDQVKRSLRLDFDTRFEILKDAEGNPLGCRFEREGHSSFEILSREKYVLRGWELELEKRISKRGFQQDFKPLKKIGKGNFASVYLATRAFDGKKVAVKAFSKELLYGQERGKESIINEIKLLRQFDHQNILKLLSVYESQNSLYLVVELLEGSSLQNHINKNTLSVEDTRGVMRGILCGIGQLGSRNVVHRDLKPDNIMFRSSRISSGLVIIDFGLATLCDEKEFVYTRCGTPGFVAPEIINIKDMASAQFSPSSDVFSAGAIFHLLLTKKSIFKGKTFNEVLSENRLCNLDLNPANYTNIDPPAFSLMCRMLQKDPCKRISVRECLNHPFFTDSENQSTSSNLSTPSASLHSKLSPQIYDLSNLITKRLQLRSNN